MSRQASLFDTLRVVPSQEEIRPAQLEVLLALRHRGVASTAEQILDTLHASGLRRREKGEVRSRLSEMADDERFVEPFVRKVGRAKAATGRRATSWDLTAAGRAKARDMEQL